ncbi:MAG: thioredoxin family protein [Cyanobacteriota bacterium]
MKFNKCLNMSIAFILMLWLLFGCFVQNVKAQTYNSAWAEQKPFIAMFYTTWCPACKTFKPMFNNIKSKHGSRIKFVSVDIDKAAALQQKHNVKLVPTVLVINPKNSKTASISMNAFASEDKFLDALYKSLQGIK